MPFERYADDAVCHCKSEAQAVALKQALQARMTEVGLALHPEKTRIVYCQDDERREDYPHVAFDFLGYTFRPRRSKNRWGKYFINFSPAISNKAAKGIRQRSRRWCWPLRSDKSLEDLSRMFNPIIQGWINYYGRYYKSALYPTPTPTGSPPGAVGHAEIQTPARTPKAGRALAASHCGKAA